MGQHPDFLSATLPHLDGHNGSPGLGASGLGRLSDGLSAGGLLLIATLLAILAWRGKDRTAVWALAFSGVVAFLLPFDAFHGDWDAYVAALYGIFQKDFCGTRPPFQGCWPTAGRISYPGPPIIWHTPTSGGSWRSGGKPTGQARPKELGPPSRGKRPRNSCTHMVAELSTRIRSGNVVSKNAGFAPPCQPDRALGEGRREPAQPQQRPVPVSPPRPRLRPWPHCCAGRLLA
jgi:hypothetical protein